jgi:zinc transport system permease protein
MALFQYEFLRNAFLAGLLISLACALVGTLIVMRKMVYLAGGIAHIAFGGVGIGIFLGINPVFSALAFSLLSALGMGLGLKRLKISEDSAIGVLWAIGMAIGALFVGLTKSYVPDLMVYLFGNILMVSTSDIKTMLILDGVITLLTLGLWKELLAVSFDPDFAWVCGVRVRLIETIFLLMVAASCVILIHAVGIVLVLALLTIPTLLSRHFYRGLKGMMMLSGLFSFGLIMMGLALSYLFNIPSGATIVLLSGIVFGFVEALRRSNFF